MRISNSKTREEKARRRVESRTMHWWDEGGSWAEIGSFDVKYPLPCLLHGPRSDL